MIRFLYWSSIHSCSNHYCGSEVFLLFHSVFPLALPDEDECSSSPCQNSATCKDGVRSFICVCLPGFTGKTCEIGVAKVVSKYVLLLRLLTIVVKVNCIFPLFIFVFRHRWMFQLSLPKQRHLCGPCEWFSLFLLGRIYWNKMRNRFAKQSLISLKQWFYSLNTQSG